MEKNRFDEKLESIKKMLSTSPPTSRRSPAAAANTYLGGE
jgi:hypothetical protein